MVCLVTIKEETHVWLRRTNEDLVNVFKRMHHFENQLACLHFGSLYDVALHFCMLPLHAQLRGLYVLHLTSLDPGSDVALDAVQTCGLAVAFATPKAMLSSILESCELIWIGYSLLPTPSYH